MTFSKRLINAISSEGEGERQKAAIYLKRRILRYGQGSVFP
jgi:hypothetical protein